MIIQFNSAHHVKATEEVQAAINALLTGKLSSFSEHITRLDVHLSDENGSKDGPNDKRCLLEAHMQGVLPLVAKCPGNTYEQATDGAVDKLKASLNSSLGRAGQHRTHIKDVPDFEITN